MSAMIVVFGFATMIGWILAFIDGYREAGARQKANGEKAYDKAYNKARKRRRRINKKIFEKLGPEKTQALKDEYATVPESEKEEWLVNYRKKYDHLAA